jgi:L-threonylcarbamoyladenylate synthase
MLINSFGKPIVSTSANISGENSPANFMEVSEKIKEQVDYVVCHKKDDMKQASSSTILKWDGYEKIETIRQ